MSHNGWGGGVAAAMGRGEKPAGTSMLYERIVRIRRLRTWMSESHPPN